MTSQTVPDRYDRILHTIGSTLDSLDVWPDHPRALEALADAAEQLIDTELETSRRRAVTLVERLDAARAWARKHLTPELETGLLAVLAGWDGEPRTVLDAPAGQSALDLIRASITAREQKADDAHDAGNYRTANEHNATVAGLRIAEAHILASLEPPKETP